MTKYHILLQKNKKQIINVEINCIIKSKIMNKIQSIKIHRNYTY